MQSYIYFVVYILMCPTPNKKNKSKMNLSLAVLPHVEQKKKKKKKKMMIFFKDEHACRAHTSKGKRGDIVMQLS